MVVWEIDSHTQLVTRFMGELSSPSHEAEPVQVVRMCGDFQANKAGSSLA